MPEVNSPGVEEAVCEEMAPALGSFPWTQIADLPQRLRLLRRLSHSTSFPLFLPFFLSLSSLTPYTSRCSFALPLGDPARSNESRQLTRAPLSLIIGRSLLRVSRP